MSEMFRYYLQKYLEKITNLESHLLVLQDKNKLLYDIMDIDLYLYPYKVIFAEENVVFRALYEDIKECRDSNYIIVLKNEDIYIKLLDFIKRSEGGRAKEITMQSLLECVEDDLKWNEEVNEFDSRDIKKRFNELIYYRKLIRKRNIEKHETDKVFLSSLVEIDAIQIKDEVDCYLYYRDIKDLHGSTENLKFNTDVKRLIRKIFTEYGSIISNVLELNLFDEFEHFLWVCCGLDSFKRLSKENLKIVLEDKYEKLNSLTSHLDKWVEFANLIGKKDKKFYIQKKDWAEKLILNAKIEILSNHTGYKEILREGTGTLINVLESIKVVLKDYNLEGQKKVFKYNLDNLYELNVLIKQNVNYKTENIRKLIDFYDLIINFFSEVEYAEKQIDFADNIKSFSEWETLYKNHLYDLQYKLSKLKYLDKHNIIEDHRYVLVDKRISIMLNEYREYFALFLEENYDDWINSPYGISRPLLNSDIPNILKLDLQKTYIIIFDGMRYDAWEYIVKPYFEKAFAGRNTKYRCSFALLPTITSISREAIYSNVLKDYKDDSSFITKSESVKKEEQLKEIILQDKKINILIYNMFDKDGHNATEDFYIFYDKQKKVFENSITELLKMITEESNIVIASDHGLMRVDEYINMKEEKGITSVKTRYLKTNGELYIDNCINIKDDITLAYDNKGYFIGGGEKHFYSHGGSSIEEVIVPFVIAESKITKEDSFFKSKSPLATTYSEILELDKDTVLKLNFKLNEKEKIILSSLYGFKNQNISSRDIEKILINKVGSAGLINAMISRLIKKLKKNGFDIFEESAVGDLIMYKFKHDNLEGEI